MKLITIPSRFAFGDKIYPIKCQAELKNGSYVVNWKADTMFELDAIEMLAQDNCVVYLSKACTDQRRLCTPHMNLIFCESLLRFIT